MHPYRSSKQCETEGCTKPANGKERFCHACRTKILKELQARSSLDREEQLRHHSDHNARSDEQASYRSVFNELEDNE